MERIFLKGKELTNSIIDWKLYRSKETFWISVTYHSGKNFKRPMEEWNIMPTYKIEGNLLVSKNDCMVKEIEVAISIGDKYILISFPNGAKQYVYNFDEIEIQTSSDIKDKNVYQYFQAFIEEQVQIGSYSNNDRPKNIQKQFQQITPSKETVLHCYCEKKVLKRNDVSQHIFPFGINATQLEAVEKAFSSQMSVIEGPPGTGKTQTILNIISNILIQNKTVAIVSNNNSAVENVYEKMEKVNLDYIIAKLGRSENRKLFFQNIKSKSKETIESNINLGDIQDIVTNLKRHLLTKNMLAQVVAEIKELEIEKECLLTWQNEQTDIEFINIDKTKLTPIQITEFIVYLRYLSDRFLSFREKMELLLHYKIFRTKFLNDIQTRNNYIFSLQLTYYNKAIAKKTQQRNEYEKTLRKHRYDDLLDDLTTKSMQYLKVYLNKNIPDYDCFSENTYSTNMADFLKRFPVIGSSTHSIMNSIGKGVLLDYVIVDESSQQSIIPGILSFGCAKNVVVVGDRKQIAHIPEKSDIHCPDPYYDNTTYSLLDSVCEVFKDKIPRTLLKEHYRCHPRIIQYCNKQFYDSELILMTNEEDNEDPLVLINTAKGNHARGLLNQRELESLEVVGYNENSETGFIAPYNAQVKLSENYLPAKFMQDTIHKFQGKECEQIIFSTVLDNKWENKNRLDFVDNASLVNVAVSRAKNKFTLITDHDVFLKHNKHIAALIRYIKYYAKDKDIYDSPAISAFDLLYSDYDKSLEKLNSRLSKRNSRYKSEQIVHVLLKDILAQSNYTAISFHQQIFLMQLVSIHNEFLTEDERQFMKNRASCDFVLYYNVGKTPFAVIEVDGGHHREAVQIRRDTLKNSVLYKANIPILRLLTTDVSIEDKIITFIDQCISSH